MSSLIRGRRGLALKNRSVVLPPPILIERLRVFFRAVWWPVVRVSATLVGLLGIACVFETAHVIPKMLLGDLAYNDPFTCLIMQYIFGWPLVAFGVWLMPLKKPFVLSVDFYWSATVVTLFTAIQIWTTCRIVSFL